MEFKQSYLYHEHFKKIKTKPKTNKNKTDVTQLLLENCEYIEDIVSLKFYLKNKHRNLLADILFTSLGLCK